MTITHYFDIVDLPTDPGISGYRTFDLPSAKAYAVRQVEKTHRRQVIRRFPFSMNPSLTVNLVTEVDIEHVSNVLEADEPSPDRLAATKAHGLA